MEKSDMNGQSFATCYMELCKEEKLRPLPAICVGLPHTLDLTTDRVKMDDWRPILNSLSLDTTLKSISIRSRYCPTKALIEDTNSSANKFRRKAPLSLTRYLLEWLSHSLAQCLKNSQVLTSLEIEGIPLPDDCLATLCVGIAATESLKHLSLQRCCIGDKNCALVCRTIANLQSIKSLNFSQCELTTLSGSTLASALSRQKLLLYHDTWKESLRYREPNLEAMPGLRRLTLNNNPMLGDLAVAQLIEAIQDNLWIKVLDLQHCGLTNVVGNQILNLINTSNTSLELIDLRSNFNLDDEIIQEISNKLKSNIITGKSEYKLYKQPFGKIENGKTSSATEAIRRQRKTHQQPKRSIAPMRKSINNNQPNNTMKLKKTISPSFTNLNRKNDKCQKENRLIVKPILHLDLQTQFNSIFNDNNNDVDESITDITTHDVEESSIELERLTTTSQMCQMECELQEEKSRREFAENKLNLMKRELEDLESVIKTKEIETRGYLLISQKSLDEMTQSFEELIKMLEQEKDGRSPNSREFIKHKIKYLLRKTKSDKEILTLGCTTKKSVKSSGDLSERSNADILFPTEDKIGDGISPKSNEHPTVLSSKSSSPCDRARQLFTQIINSNVMLDLNTGI
uniref:Centrosomal protein of 78 kDa n=1 Tax=Bracon brevicornis TaxID=1563983 RepID=A0A6V7M231_9HYME